MRGAFRRWWRRNVVSSWPPSIDELLDDLSWLTARDVSAAVEPDGAIRLTLAPIGAQAAPTPSELSRVEQCVRTWAGSELVQTYTVGKLIRVYVPPPVARGTV